MQTVCTVSKHEDVRGTCLPFGQRFNLENVIDQGCCRTASVVWWSEILATSPEVPDSIPGATAFSEKYWVWNGVQSAS
jgi:hypothetical protein